MAVDFILICGLFITALVLLLILRKKEKRTSQYLLAIFLASNFFLLLSFWADEHQMDALFNLSFLLSNSIGYLMGPIILFYTYSLFGHVARIGKKNWLHFVPYGLHLLLVTFPFTLQYSEISGGSEYLNILDELEIPLSLLEVVYFGVYTMVALRFFLKARRLYRNQFSQLESKDLTWSKWVLVSVLASLIVETGLATYEIAFGELSWNTSYFSLASITILTTFLTYQGISNSRVLIPNGLAEAIQAERSNSNKEQVYVSGLHLENRNEVGETHSLPQISNDSEVRKVNSRNTLEHLAPEELDRLIHQIQEALEKDKLYLNDSLTLHDLASEISIGAKTLSGIINQEMGTTFYELVNSYRVESVKEKLKTNSYHKYSLLGIGQESGFKSKSSFYRIFRKHTGMTPAEYKKQFRHN